MFKRRNHLLKYTTHLLRHTVKKCPQRIKDTPAVLFYRIPCICIVYFKRLTERLFYYGATENAQRIKDTPPLYLPAIFPSVIYKKGIFTEV